jgi:hypothetical protein
MGYNLASFKNSRISPTPATTQATQENLTVLPNTTADPLPVFYPANPQRTYLELENLSTTDGFQFVNYSGSGPIPTVAEIQANGFLVGPGVAYEIDSPEAVYALSTTAAPVPVDSDEGND